MTTGPSFTLEHFTRSEHKEPAAPAAPAAGPRRARILVVDDEESITDLLSEFLVEMQYDVTAAHSGRAALEQLDAVPIDAVLLDLHMPGMDGIETLRRILARDPKVPVLMITGNDDLAVAKEALALGAFDHILKPIDFEYLVRALVKMAGSQRPAPSSSGGASSGLPAAPGSTAELLYELALEVVRMARSFSREARESMGLALEQIAIAFVQRGSSSEKAAERGDVLRGINNLRTLLRFAKDLGDIDDETHRRFESRIVKARSSMGLG